VYIYDMNSLSKETAWWIMFRLIMSDISCISHCLLLPKFAHIHTTILQNMNDAAQM
jgi:hypothetical protein